MPLLKKNTLTQALIALSFDLGGILSGRIALVFYPLFQAAPWILALFPPILSVRGNVGGIFSGKLSTMLHTGEAEAKLRGNTEEFYSLVKSVFTLIFLDTAAIGIVAFGINYLFGNAKANEALLFVVIPPISCLLAMAIALPAVTLIGIAAFKRGLDPDILLYPVMSTMDDIIVTICYVAVVGITLLPGTLLLLTAIALILGILFLVVTLRSRRERVFRRTLREGGPMILLSSLLGILGGVGLASIRSKIEERPAVLMLYPALIDTLGDIGSIIGNLETTKLAVGIISGVRQTIREAFSDLISVELAAAFMHVLFGLTTFLLARATGLSSDPLLLVGLALTSNLLSFFFVSTLSLFAAVQTFRRGLDPDNFVIPLVTSVSDLGATLALIAAIQILGV